MQKKCIIVNCISAITNKTCICIVFFPQGIIQGEEEFADGLTFGVRSMVGHTLGQLIICIKVKNQEMYHNKYAFVI